MRSGDEVELVRSLVERGFNDCAIARLTGLPRTTVRDWRISKRWLPRAPIPGISGRMSPGRRCGGCGGALHDLEALPDSYAYLLGLYLGDGCLSEGRRGVLRLRIVLDERYAGIINECVVAMARVLPSNRPHVQRLHSAKAVEVGISSKQLRCLFPQHAPGRKHERRIVLLRGLIHSRYNFSNRSDDIRRIFCHTCDELGIEWRVMNWWDISVARRESVARLDEFVGPQA